MKDNYHQIMDHVEVTEEMRSRILGNIEKEMENTPDTTENRKVIRFARLEKIISVAAAVALLLTGTYFFQNRLRPVDPTDTNPPVMSGGMKAVSDISELEEEVGFSVEELNNLPFEVQKTQYTAYSDMAEITWLGEDEAITYRKSAGGEDNSGSFTEYQKETEAEVLGITVCLKGSERGYPLVTWSDESYSYSLSAGTEYAEEVWLQMITELLGS